MTDMTKREIKVLKIEISKRNLSFFSGDASIITEGVAGRADAVSNDVPERV